MKKQMKNKKSSKLSRAIVCLLFIACSVMPSYLFAQGAAINTTGASADNSAMLDVSSTTQGVLVSRMTNAQKLAIPSPATGLMIYQTDGAAGFYYFTGSAWKFLGSDNLGNHIATQILDMSTKKIINVATCTQNADATNKKYVDSTVAAGGGGGAPCTGPPPTPGPIIGPKYVSANTTYFYMVSQVAGATTYTWSYSGNGAAISGTTNPVYINFSSNATSGNLTVTASCGNGNSTSNSFPINVNTSCGFAQFYYIGAMQIWTVPAGINWVTLDCIGASGAEIPNGGKGGEAKGTLAVTQGQVLNIFVGGYGGSTGGYGWNGGGYGIGSRGGGASDVRIGGTDLGSRVIIAGGGGAQGYYNGHYYYGGIGGGYIGGTGSTVNGQGGGSGGTQSSGGTGGFGTTSSGSSGSLGQGGSGGGGQSGGGGGGYYGGGGSGGYDNSAAAGGGGGGSNYFAPSVTIIANGQGVQSVLTEDTSGNLLSGGAQVTVSW